MLVNVLSPHENAHSRNVTTYYGFCLLSQEDMRAKMEIMLDPDKLQQFTIAGTVVEFDETLAGGKHPQSGMLSVKFSDAKKADRKGKAKGGKAVLHGDVGGGRATYNPGRNVKNLGHATGRPDDVSMGATKPPALEEAAEKEEEENLLGNLWTEVQEQCWLAGPTTLMLMVQYVTGLIVISFVGLLGAQYLTTISLTNCFAISLVSTFWYLWVMFFSSKFPPTDMERERRQELDNTDQTTIITLYWDFFCSKD
ncbi:unnamed protein product [Sphagnum jensenii]|uniref:Transmembrane protein n=1 Tax=Sphagnum jensenii TaxID=128206 RepID=A0ABP1B5G7_9BRYO